MRTALLGLLLPALSAAAPASPVDSEKLYRHIRKSFSAPPSLKLVLKELKPSAVPGFLSGTLEIGDGPQQVQTLSISGDGRYYFLSAAYRLAPSNVPGLRSAAAEGKGPAAPPIFVSEDGRAALYGPPQDLSVDPDQQNLAKMRLGGVPASGPEDAPVVIVEYSDLQCPHCKNAHDVLAKELAPYAGKVRVVFKHYPLKHIHPWAYDAALAVACGGLLAPKGAKALEDSFFAEQASIQKDSVRAKSLEFGRKAGLDEKRFAACLDGSESKKRVDADIAEGESLGVQGTPTLFVNGRRTRTYAFEELKPLIDEFLAEGGKK